MVLFQMIIQIAVRAMSNGLPEHSFDGSWIGIVSITGDPLRDTTGHRTCGAKEGLCSCLVPFLTEPDIHQIPIPIDRPIEVD